MKVAQLIEKLQKCDPEFKVAFIDEKFGDQIIEIVVQGKQQKRVWLEHTYRSLETGYEIEIR